MGFFDDIGGGFKSVFGGIKDFAGDVFNQGKGLVTGVFGGIKDLAQPITNAAGGIINKAGDLAGRVADKGLNQLDNISNLLTNPFVIIGGLVVGGIVVSKLLDSGIPQKALRI